MNENGKMKREVSIEVPTVTAGKSYTLKLVEGELVQLVPPLSFVTHPVKIEALERALSELKAIAGGGS